MFWATWCPYCKAFMPYLRRIQADYAHAGVTVVAVNAKERGEGDPKAYVRSLGFPLIGIPDGDGIAEAYGVQYIPGLFVVDGKGTIAYRRGAGPTCRPAAPSRNRGTVRCAPCSTDCGSDGSAEAPQRWPRQEATFAAPACFVRYGPVRRARGNSR